MKKKAIKIIGHPLLLPFMWFSYLATLLMSLGRFKYLSGNFGDNRLLSVFFSIGWKTSSLIGIMFLLVLVAWVYIYIRGESTIKNKFSFFIIGLTSVITLFVSASFVNQENLNFGNYLYSLYGITKQSFELLSHISLITAFLFGAFLFNEFDGLKNKKKVKNRFGISNKILISIPFLGILVWFSLQILFKASDYLLYAKFTYGDEFENYKSMDRLNEVVSENSAVIIPVQGVDWPDISNAPIVRYFLFPRIIVSSSDLTNQEKAAKLKEAYFISLNKNNNLFWPIIDREKEVVYFAPDNPLGYSDLIEINKENGMVIYKIIFRK